PPPRGRDRHRERRGRRHARAVRPSPPRLNRRRRVWSDDGMATRTLPATVTGRYAILIFRDGMFLRSIGVVKHRVSVGSDIWSDIVLDDPELSERIGTISDKGGDLVFLETEGGRVKRELALFEPVHFGRFTIVRVPAGEIADHVRLVEDLLRDTAGAPQPVAAALEE